MKKKSIITKFKNESGLLQLEVARLLGVSQSLISLIEKGERGISPQLAKKLIKKAKRYDCIYTYDDIYKDF